ncbi:phosphoenolpyruvate synthase [Novimethylophilus kurashikiensis]|uniref:Phosphoenolpyruvate synthase n=1 Tax=Novimethylophilus kurashikiensis TaxID=1825523 RepID=A0A2R5F9D5_9PROT|nr:hypothetical protein [Novimethylophilus kurashikiensis]GBG14852.1 phosphoenolpyruvate synthase [Novimethylophilus kurashikiensis]
MQQTILKAAKRKLRHLASKTACFFGHHRWRYTPAEFYDEHSQRLGIVMKPATRTCCRGHCGKLQKEDLHCLGLNPPEYVRTWYNA